jgi:hypothetical protein
MRGPLTPDPSDRGPLDRVMANLMDDDLRHTPDGRHATIRAHSDEQDACTVKSSTKDPASLTPNSSTYSPHPSGSATALPAATACPGLLLAASPTPCTTPRTTSRAYTVGATAPATASPCSDPPRPRRCHRRSTPSRDTKTASTTVQSELHTLGDVTRGRACTCNKPSR